MSLPRRFLWSALLALAALVPSAARAQSGMVGRMVPVCVVRAAPGMTAARLFATPGRFDCATRQTAFGPGDYWVLSAPVSDPDSVRRPPVIRFASLWQQRTTLYARYADGAVRGKLLDDHGTARALQLGAIVEQRFRPRGVPVTRLLWHVEGSANLRGILVGTQLTSPARSARSNVVMAALYAGFVGLCLALLVHNIALWRALRLRFQLAYVAMLGTLIVYALSSSGALVWLFPDLPNTLRMRLNYVMLGLSAGSAVTFARCFFEPRIFAGWLGRVASLATGWTIGSGLLFALLAPWRIAWLDLFFSLSFVAVLSCVMPLLWRAWRLRSDYLWLFALAWGAPIVLAGVRVIHNIAPLGWNLWLDNSTLLAMTCESLLSSVAITYRVRGLARERDEARAQEIAARVLADTDPLTGLLNRRAFLRGAIGRAGDQVLLVADIDYFKRVNDTIGHDGGDEVLRILARTLRAVAPPDALVARIGGEEFAIIAARETAPEPEMILARLRAARMPFDIAVTASIGGSSGPLASEADWKALYNAADRALFDAKRAGRDRSRLAKGNWAIAA